MLSHLPAPGSLLIYTDEDDIFYDRLGIVVSFNQFCSDVMWENGAVESFHHNDCDYHDLLESCTLMYGYMIPYEEVDEM